MHSFEGRQLGLGVGQNSVQDLGALVNFTETLLSDGNTLGGEALAVLNEVLLEQIDNVVGTTAYLREMVQHQGSLLKSDVAPQTLVDDLVLNDLPELVVLQVHSRTSGHSHLERGRSLSIKTLELLLDHRNDNVPELFSLFELVLSDLVEAVHNLLVSHVLGVLLVDEHNVVGVLRVVKSKVNLVEVLS